MKHILNNYNMKHLFLPPQLAVLLKALGFNETCIAVSKDGNPLFYAEFKCTHEYYKDYGQILYSQAIDWLETKGIYVDRR